MCVYKWQYTNLLHTGVLRAGGAEEWWGNLDFCLGPSSGGVKLHEAPLSWVGCAGSIQMYFNQSLSLCPFRQERWTSGKSSKTHPHGCAPLALSALTSTKKYLYLVNFLYPIKYTALDHGLHHKPPKYPIKKHSLPGKDNQGMQIIDFKCLLDTELLFFCFFLSVYAGLWKQKFGASMDENTL